MGSFTEITLAFTVAADAPPSVLAALGAEAVVGEGAPPLPSFDQFAAGDFAPDDYLGNFEFDGLPMRPELPVDQQAAMWRHVTTGWADNAYFPGTPASVLRWDQYSERWTFTARSYPKEAGVWVRAIVEPLGRWATDGSADEPAFVGYLRDDYSPRPVLIWSHGQQPFQFEGAFDDEADYSPE